MFPVPSILAEDLTMAANSALIMLTLLVLLGIASGTYLALVWRETSARRSVALSEWARATGYYSNPLARIRPPHPLERFGDNVRVHHCFTSTQATVVEFSTRQVSPATEQTPDPAVAPAPPIRYHALIWPIGSDWPSVALRPTHGAVSVCDLMHLPSQAARYDTQRFVILTDHRRTGRVIADSRLRGLLPADIGLVLTGTYLLLDFTGRPFDGIEFNRMIAIAEQVVAHLPAV